MCETVLLHTPSRQQGWCQGKARYRRGIAGTHCVLKAAEVQPMRPFIRSARQIGWNAVC
jgi:hypothetical protein